MEELRSALATVADRMSDEPGVIAPVWRPRRGDALAPDGLEAPAPAEGRALRDDQAPPPARTESPAAAENVAGPGRWPERGLAALATAGLAAWLVATLVPSSPVAPLVAAWLAGTLVIALPRVGWLAFVLAVAVWLAFEGRTGAALVVGLAGLLPALVVPWRATAWGLPVGAPALGVHVVRLAGEFPNARVILAHAGITDLSWIWRAASDLPNLLFDTSWWMPADLLALFSLVPPGQIVFASDAPYGHTLASASSQLRLALQAGLSPEQVKLLASGQSLRLARGESLAPGGPAIGEREHASHLLLDRLAEFLLLGTIMTFRGGDGSEMLSLARLACEVPDEVDDAPVFDAIRRLLWIYDEITRMEPENRRRLVFLMMAITVAKTPDVPIPR